MKKKFFIITTVSDSLPFFKGQINVLKKHFHVELVSSPGIYLDEICNEHDVKGHALWMSREISIINDITSLCNLIMLFNKEKPFIVHGNTPKGGFLSMIASFILGVPKRIYYIHGLRYQGEVGKKRKILMFMEKLSCLFATHIVAVSQGVKNTLEADKITSKEINVIWNGSINGIDLNYFNPKNFDSQSVRESYGFEKEDFVFGFVGRLVNDKGISELVSAFKSLQKISSNIKLILVGKFEGRLDPLHQNTIFEIESNPNIISTGIKKDVRPYFSAMDLFVFPSYREGFGLVLMEAGAMSLPAISSNIIGCNEVIVDSKNGFLIPSKNEKDLYDKMLFCLVDRENLARMGMHSRELVNEKFEQKKLWEMSLEFYKEISLQ